MRRSRTLVLGAALLALVVSACSPGEGDATATDGGGESQAANLPSITVGAAQPTRLRRYFGLAAPGEAHSRRPAHLAGAATPQESRRLSSRQRRETLPPVPAARCRG